MRPRKDVKVARVRLVLPEGMPFPIAGALEAPVGAPGHGGGHGGGGHGGGGR